MLNRETGIKRSTVPEMVGMVRETLESLAACERLRPQKLKDWTREAIFQLAAAADSFCDNNPLCSFASGLQEQGRRYGGEWLYDLCWLQYAGPNSDTLVRMPLALESEWGTDTQILEDFQKLMVSRAELRVMIFGERNRSTETTVNRLRQQLSAFKGGSTSDRYLLAGYDTPSFEFHLLDGDGDCIECDGRPRCRPLPAHSM